jgi:hypothetical protein
MFTPFTLWLIPRSMLSHRLLPRLAELAGQGGLQVVDAAFLFNPYALAAHLAASGLNPHLFMPRVQIARAFTCYQVETLLGQLPDHDPSLVVLGLLMTFQDEAVRLNERRRLLATCLRRLRSYPGTVLVVENTLDARPDMIDMLRRAAGAVVESTPPAVLLPPTLF